MTDRLLNITVSTDGGHTFGRWSEHDLGDEGQFDNRVVRHRLGMARQMVLRIRTTSPCTVDILAASAQIDGER